jgi:uncharacterized protein YcfL
VNKIIKLLVMVCITIIMVAGCSSKTDVEEDADITGRGDNEPIEETEIVDLNKSSTEGSEVADADNSNSNESENVESYNFVYGEWNNYTITIDGKEFTLPCKYIDIVNAFGQVLEDYDYNTYLPAGCSVKEGIDVNSQDGSVYIFAQVKVKNVSQEDLPITECMVVRFDITNSKLDEWEHDIVLPGDIKMSDALNESELVSRLGNMSWINDMGYHKTYSWNVSHEYPEHNCYQIKTSDGIVSNVVLDCTYANGFPEMDPAEILSDPDNLGTDWLTFEMCIGGTKLKLPTAVKDLNNLFGLVLEPDSTDKDLRARGMAYADFLDKDGNEVLGADFSNRTDNEALVRNCAIDTLYFNSKQIKDTLNVPIRFPGGLCLGELVNLEYLIKLWGDPDTMRLQYYSSSNEIVTNVRWYEDGTTNYIELGLNNGILNNISYNGGMVLPWRK